MVESRLIESYGNVLLETFTRKKSYFENPPPKKKMYRESSIRVKQPTTFRFSLHYSSCILLVNQCDLTYILLHN